MTGDVVFDLRGANLGYQQRTVLRALDLQIECGEKVALLGESGAGKSTLLRHLRTLRPQEVAWCPQQSGLVPILSVFHNIYMGRLDQHSFFYNLANLMFTFKGPRDAVAVIANELGIGEKLFTSVEKLSGGQQSRTSLARALFQQRAIFIGDEPVSAVDEMQADQLMQLICARHATVVMALHDVELALRHCTRIIGLRDGVIELDQPVARCSAASLLQLYAAA